MTHLRRSDYYVIDMPLVVARRLIGLHHYAHGCSNTATFCHGLYKRGDALDAFTCLGVAWWIPPTKVAARATWNGDWQQVLSLSRLVIVPNMPTNAASFLIAQSIKRIRRDGRFKCLVTYADTFQGHTGTIYRATNWEYMGLQGNHATYIDPETERIVACKSHMRTRTHAEMLALGYEAVGRYGKHKFRMLLAPEPINSMKIVAHAS